MFIGMFNAKNYIIQIKIHILFIKIRLFHNFFFRINYWPKNKTYHTVFKHGHKILTWFRSWPFFRHSTVLEACRLSVQMVATHNHTVSAAEDADPACKRTSYEQIYLLEGRQILRVISYCWLIIVDYTHANI